MLPGLKTALDEGVKLWSRRIETHEQGVYMAGAKRCLLSLNRLRERTGKLMTMEVQATRIARDIARLVKRVVDDDDPGSSATVSILSGHSGGDDSAGRDSANTGRMAHPSSSDGETECPRAQRLKPRDLLTPLLWKKHNETVRATHIWVRSHAVRDKQPCILDPKNSNRKELCFRTKPRTHPHQEVGGSRSTPRGRALKNKGSGNFNVKSSRCQP